MSLIDFIGALFSLICTYLFVKEDKHAWPLTALAIPFDAYVYFQKQLYGDVCLQFIYLSLTAYGWQQWRNLEGEALQTRISSLTKAEFIKLSIFCITAIMLLNPLLRPFNQANIAYLDAITTVLSICAQWLLCKKKIETWLVWFIVDGLYVYLYALKALPFHSVMTLTYLFMAIAGWRQWCAKKSTLMPESGDSSSSRAC